VQARHCWDELVHALVTAVLHLQPATIGKSFAMALVHSHARREHLWDVVELHVTGFLQEPVALSSLPNQPHCIQDGKSDGAAHHMQTHATSASRYCSDTVQLNTVTTSSP
jgi:hypothetical protein